MRQGKWSIPTTYNGIRYRSKLEADWARFFDRHRMKYAYESEGFDLNGLWYLPDFYLPEIKTFVEVKGALDDLDRGKLLALAKVCANRDMQVILAESPAGKRYRAVWPTPSSLKFQEETMHCLDPGEKPDPDITPLAYLSGDEWVNGVIAFRTSSQQMDDKIRFQPVTLQRCDKCGCWHFTELYPKQYCPACGAASFPTPEELDSFYEADNTWR